MINPKTILSLPGVILFFVLAESAFGKEYGDVIADWIVACFISVLLILLTLHFRFHAW